MGTPYSPRRMSIKGSCILLRPEESCQAARRTYSGVQAEDYKLSRKARIKPNAYAFDSGDGQSMEGQWRFPAGNPKNRLKCCHQCPAAIEAKDVPESKA